MHLLLLLPPLSPMGLLIGCSSPISDCNPAMCRAPSPYPVPGPEPASRSMTYSACLYPTGPPAAHWCGPEDPLCATCTGYPYSHPFFCASTPPSTPLPAPVPQPHVPRVPIALPRPFLYPLSLVPVLQPLTPPPLSRCVLLPLRHGAEILKLCASRSSRPVYGFPACPHVPLGPGAAHCACSPPGCRLPYWRDPDGPFCVLAPVALRASPPPFFFLLRLSRALPLLGSSPQCSPPVHVVLSLVSTPLAVACPLPPLPPLCVSFCFGPFAVVGLFSGWMTCVFAFFFHSPPCMHAQHNNTAQMLMPRHCCPRSSRALALLGQAPWHSTALPGWRPSLVTPPLCFLSPPPAVARLSPSPLLTAPLWPLVRRATPLLATPVSFLHTRAAQPPACAPPDRTIWAASAGTPPVGFSRHPSPPPSPPSAP